MVLGQTRFLSVAHGNYAMFWSFFLRLAALSGSRQPGSMLGNFPAPRKGGILGTPKEPWADISRRKRCIWRRPFPSFSIRPGGNCGRNSSEIAAKRAHTKSRSTPGETQLALQKKICPTPSFFDQGCARWQRCRSSIGRLVRCYALGPFKGVKASVDAQERKPCGSNKHVVGVKGRDIDV